MSLESSAKKLLSVDKVTVRFGGLVALSDLTMTVQEGELVGLIGPNGAGKTTAFNVITGFLSANSGTVRYGEHSLHKLRPHQIAALGIVRTFQKTSLFMGVSVFDNVLIGLHRVGSAQPWEILLALPKVRHEERELRMRAIEVLEFVGLGQRKDDTAGALPYGEQRLLEVAIALAARPSLLLLDEPVSGMNPAETESFMRLVHRLRAEGLTILLVEHDMRMVMGVSDRVLVLNQGTIIADGTPLEIQRNPEVIRAYLGQGASHVGN